MQDLPGTQNNVGGPLVCNFIKQIPTVKIGDFTNTAVHTFTYNMSFRLFISPTQLSIAQLYPHYSN